MLLAACSGSRSDAQDSAKGWKDWNRFAERYIQAARSTRDGIRWLELVARTR